MTTTQSTSPPDLAGSGHLLSTSLCQIVMALASLDRQVSDKYVQLYSDLRRISAELSRLGQEEISRAAHEAEAVVQRVLAGATGLRDECVDALDHLAEGLLVALVEYAHKHHSGAGSIVGLERKVLVVDDSRVAAMALSNALAERDFLVRSVSTMEEAVTELSSFKPTVLVSDIHMPDLDVAILAKSFRETAHDRPTLVLLVSSATGLELLTRLRQVRPEAFVPKSAGTAAVVHRVEELWEALNGKTINEPGSKKPPAT